jgi:fluoride exporter
VVTILVTVAAGIGAVARYLVDGAVQRRTNSPFPFGTLAVNLTGSFVLGLLVGLSAHHGLATSTGAVLGAGFAGGYTTLSTWAWESIALAERGARSASTLNVIGSLGLGMAAGAAGLGLALLG